MILLVFLLIEFSLGVLTGTTFSHLLGSILLFLNAALFISGGAAEDYESTLLTGPPIVWAVGAVIGYVCVIDWVTVWVQLSPYLIR